MASTPLKLFLTQFQLCSLNHQLKINQLGIHFGLNHTNSMVMEMNYFLYVAIIRVSLLLLHVRYVVLVLTVHGAPVYYCYQTEDVVPTCTEILVACISYNLTLLIVLIFIQPKLVQIVVSQSLPCSLFCFISDIAIAHMLCALQAQSAAVAEVWLWQVGSWKAVGHLQSHSLTVTQMEFSHDDNFLLTVSRDRQFSVFSITRTGIYVIIVQAFEFAPFHYYYYLTIFLG